MRIHQLSDDVLRIDVMDPRGFVLDVYAYRFAEPSAEPCVAVRGVESVREAEGFLLRAGATAIRVAASDGTLQAETEGRLWLAGGPYLMLLPLNGEGGAQMTGSAATGI